MVVVQFLATNKYAQDIAGVGELNSAVAPVFQAADCYARRPERYPGNLNDPDCGGRHSHRTAPAMIDEA